MSGVYQPMIIGFGAVSAIVAVYVGRRMDAVDGAKVPMALRPLKFASYLVWLMVEIAKSNITVTKAILSPAMGLRQNLFRTPCSQKTDLAQVIFANSITLTPGTITVETETDFFWVHALTYSSEDPDALAGMDARVSATETGREA